MKMEKEKLTKSLIEVPEKLRAILEEIVKTSKRKSYASALYNDLKRSWGNLEIFMEILKQNYIKLDVEDLITMDKFWKVTLYDLEEELKKMNKKQKASRGAELILGYFELFANEVQWLLEKIAEKEQTYIQMRA